MNIQHTSDKLSNLQNIDKNDNKHVKSEITMPSLFGTKGSGKCDNDYYNKQRENIMVILLDDFKWDQQTDEFKEKWLDFKTKCNKALAFIFQSELKAKNIDNTLEIKYDITI